MHLSKNFTAAIHILEGVVIYLGGACFTVIKNKILEDFYFTNHQMVVNCTYKHTSLMVRLFE